MDAKVSPQHPSPLLFVARQLMTRGCRPATASRRRPRKQTSRRCMLTFLCYNSPSDLCALFESETTRTSLSTTVQSRLFTRGTNRALPFRWLLPTSSRLAPSELLSAISAISRTRTDLAKMTRRYQPSRPSRSPPNPSQLRTRKQLH